MKIYNGAKLITFYQACSVIFVCAALSLSISAQIKPKDPRSTTRAFFTLLKTGQYAALYDFLPGQLQQQMTREQLAQSMKRLDSFIAIDRMQIGRIQQNGDFAVVDTTIYGNLKKPIKVDGEEVSEGRVSVQQFLFKENGQWKIATADNRTRDYFIKKNPEFNRQFQFSQPQFEFKQKGKWAPIAQAMRRQQSSPR